MQIAGTYKPAYCYGGPIWSVSGLCEELLKQGVTVRVLSTNANGPKDLNVITGVPQIVDGVEVLYYRRITGDHTSFSPALLLSLWRTMKEYDVIHLNSWWNLVSIPACILCRLRGIRPVLSPRGSVTRYTFTHHFSQVKKWFHRLIGERLLRSCTIHVTSKQESDDLLQCVNGIQDIRTIPNLLRIPDVRTTERINSDRLQILYFGRIDPKKRIDFLIEMLNEGFHIPYTLSIVGPGDKEYIDQLKLQSKANPNIIWRDPVYDQSKWEVLAEADVLVLPSYNENYGNAVLEALSQGTPVIVSDTVGIGDWVLANKLGWVAAHSSEAWHEALKLVFEKPSERARIRREGPEFVKRDFGQSALIDEYMKLYTDASRSQTSRSF